MSVVYCLGAAGVSCLAVCGLGVTGTFDGPGPDGGPRPIGSCPRPIGGCPRLAGTGDGVLGLGVLGSAAFGFGLLVNAANLLGFFSLEPPKGLPRSSSDEESSLWVGSLDGEA